MVLDLKISSEYRDSVTKYSDEQLDAMEMAVEIPWEPSAVSKIEAHPNVIFVVFVRDVRSMASAAVRLSRSLKFDITTLETGRLALSGKSDKKWQDFIRGLGSVASQGLILRLVTKAIERGNRVDGFAEVVDDILFDGVRPQDADVIARAQDLRRRK
jgi:hypothetical protein